MQREVSEEGWVEVEGATQEFELMLEGGGLSDVAVSLLTTQPSCAAGGQGQKTDTPVEKAGGGELLESVLLEGQEGEEEGEESGEGEGEKLLALRKRLLAAEEQVARLEREKSEWTRTEQSAAAAAAELEPVLRANAFSVARLQSLAHAMAQFTNQVTEYGMQQTGVVTAAPTGVDSGDDAEMGRSEHKAAGSSGRGRRQRSEEEDVDGQDDLSASERAVADGAMAMAMALDTALSKAEHRLDEAVLAWGEFRNRVVADPGKPGDVVDGALADAKGEELEGAAPPTEEEEAAAALAAAAVVEEEERAEAARLEAARRLVAQDKVSVRNFADGDMVLFLPMPSGEYLAFNVNTPHHYLSQASKALIGHDRHFRKFYVLGRVVLIEEFTATARQNPYRLPKGTKYKVLHVASVHDLSG